MAAAATGLCGVPHVGFLTLAASSLPGSSSGATHRVASSQPRRLNGLRIRAASVVDFEIGEHEKDRWTGDDPLARIVRSLLAIKPLYNALKFGAKTYMIRNAEKDGIPWNQMVEDLKVSTIYAEKELLENVDISYPEYYTKEFHGYNQGNLCWEAAFEVESATMVIFKRAYPSLDSAQAVKTLRGKWLHAIESHHTKFCNGLPATAILDVGCSSGSSTRFLRDHFPMAQVTGLDLSPYFLAVAQYIEKQDDVNSSTKHRPIQYIHANGEETGLPSHCYDIISFSFVLHECPRSAVTNLIKEAHRLLKPGGTISFAEQYLKSKVVQNMPPAVFMMMKSTEPWLDEFYRLNLKDELERNGYTNITTVMVSPRHFTLTATAAS